MSSFLWLILYHLVSPYFLVLDLAIWTSCTPIEPSLDEDEPLVSFGLSILMSYTLIETWLVEDEEALVSAFVLSILMRYTLIETWLDEDDVTVAFVCPSSLPHPDQLLHSDSDGVVFSSSTQSPVYEAFHPLLPL